MVYVRLALGLIKPAATLAVVVFLMLAFGVDVSAFAWSLYDATLGAAIDYLLEAIADRLTFW
jgi:uncharacterized membrane protein YdfJ with MMPL/SSD domain